MENLINTISIKVDGKVIKFDLQPLPCETTCFKVDFRGKIVVPIVDKECKHKLEFMLLKLKELDSNASPETDENLFAVSFFADNYKICIGTTGDVTSLNYKYNNYSVIVEGLFPFEEYLIFISYIKNVDSKNELYPWLAIDPGFEK